MAFKKSSKRSDGRLVSEKYRSPQSQVRVSYSAVGKLLFKRVGFAVLAVLVTVAVLFVCFSATLLRAVPTFNSSGAFVPVKNMTYEGGFAPEGEYLLVEKGSEKGTDIISRLAQSFTPAPNSMVVRTEAGPYGKLSWTEPDILSVDGNPVNAPVPPVLVPQSNELRAPMIEVSPLENREEDYLQEEYIGECISGNCTPGEGVIFSQENIYGTLIQDPVENGVSE